MLSDRINTILKETGLSKSEFARKTGVTPAAVWQVLNRGKGISAQFAKMVEISLGYRAEWVLTGEGEKKVAEDNYERRRCMELVEGLNDAELRLLAQFIEKLKGLKDEKP